MRSLFVVVLAAGVLSLAAGCGKKDSTSGGATPEGTYFIESIEIDGQNMTDVFFAKAPESERIIRFSGNTMTTTKRGKDETIEVKYDTSKSPARLTTTEKMSDGSIDTTYAIYKIEGDTLTICESKGIDSKEEDRPKEFKAVKGDNKIMITLKKK